jgi:hypothetical protein
MKGIEANRGREKERGTALTQVAINHPLGPTPFATLSLLADNYWAVRTGPEKKELPVLGFTI